MTPMLIQIQRWLMQANVWRFVGFASTVVGLLCYALSSSFNHLFGEWNLLKIFLYSVFSIIICLAMLFAKVWQHSTSLLFKAHLAFLVLAITSVYSFFFDKAVNGKPDAYSLVSCAAFAIMSLSLSRQIHCGFEVDLLYFFLGCLIIQLMKIKLLLAIVGAGFSYSLIILRSSLHAPSETEYLGLQDHVIIQVDSQQVNTDSTAPIMTLDAPPDSHSQQANTDSALIMPQLMACIKALKKKNRKLIRMLFNHVHEYLKADLYSNENEISLIPIPQLQSDPNLVMDALQSKIINDLHETVMLMVAAGFEEECCHVYSNCRSEFLQECMSIFGLQELNTEDVDKMERIQSWIKASNIAFKILFPNERRLCDRIFFGFSPAADLSFMELCRELTIHLLNFANTCAIESCLPSVLRGNLRVFDTLDDLIPEFESLFSNQYSVSLMNEAITIRKRLGEAIRGIFMKLENLIRLDTTREAAPDGGIHPITLQVIFMMHRFCNVFRARDKLEKVFKEYPADREGTSSSLSVQMAFIIELLESNLEAKSKSYTDPALGYVFMMNNGSYIEQIAKFVGSKWVRKYAAKVRQSWDKVLDFLKLDNNESVTPNVAAESMKEKLNLFNMHFKEICSVQSTWFVYDKQLREEIRISLENILLPSYGKFIGRFQDVLGKHADEHIEYGMYGIKALLNDLFRGSMPKEKVRIRRLV